MRYADFPFLIYRVSKGMDPYVTNRAPDLRTAINFCNLHKDVHHDIQLPDGTWYEWPKEIPVVTEGHFLALDPDVVEMEIEPARANEILRRMHRIIGVQCDVKWMEEVVKKAVDNYDL